MINDFNLNDTVEMKKEHPCKKSKYWKVIEFERKLKKIIEKAPQE